MRTERKPPFRAVQRLYHLRQGDYSAKDDSIFKQVQVVSRFTTGISSTKCRNKLESVTRSSHWP